MRCIVHPAPHRSTYSCCFHVRIDMSNISEKPYVTLPACYLCSPSKNNLGRQEECSSSGRDATYEDFLGFLGVASECLTFGEVCELLVVTAAAGVISLRAHNKRAQQTAGGAAAACCVPEAYHVSPRCVLCHKGRGFFYQTTALCVSGTRIPRTSTGGVASNMNHQLGLLTTSHGDMERRWCISERSCICFENRKITSTGVVYQAGNWESMVCPMHVRMCVSVCWYAAAAPGACVGRSSACFCCCCCC